MTELEPGTYICRICGKGPFKGDRSVCHNCRRKPLGKEKKICPKCGKEHKQPKGVFCSIACSKSREFTEETRLLKSQKNLEFHQSPEASLNQKRQGDRITAVNKKEEFNAVPIEEYAVAPPDPRTLDDYEVFLDGFEKTGNW